MCFRSRLFRALRFRSRLFWALLCRPGLLRSHSLRRCRRPRPLRCFSAALVLASPEVLDP